jgi:hypothetical protein
MVKRQMELSLGAADTQHRPAAKPDDARWWFARMYQAVEEAVIPQELQNSDGAPMWSNPLAERTEPLGLSRKMVLAWKSPRF